MEKICYNVKEVSKMLGVALPTVYDLCDDPNFPAIRISERRIIIPADGLKKWLDDNKGKKVC